MKKKLITLIVTLAMLTASGSAIVGCRAASSNDISVTYDGDEIEMDVTPQIIDDRVMVPMRAIFEEFGAYVKWDSETRTITAKKKSKTITMTINSTEMTKNDETYTTDVAPTIVDGRTLVPVRAVSELLGLDVKWDEDDKEVVITSADDEDDDAWKENTGTIDLTNMSVTGEGIEVEGSTITITSGGDFTVTGQCSDGMIYINTEDKVKLRLSGMSLTNEDGPAIFFENVDKGYITLTDGTENYLSDGTSEYTVDAKGVISSKDNLEIKGNGTLTVNANYNHGISASDSLEIGNGNITITAANDGIHVNDTLEITGGNITITAEGDGMQSEDIVGISGDAKINITTTGEVASSSNNMFMGRENQSETTETETTDSVSSKGIKAEWMLRIDGGEITINSTDHAIHSADEIDINGGTIEIASDNKGISAHGDLNITDGSITITESTEGIESKAVMTISGGDIDVTASDDGLNAGGNGSEMFGGMGGAPMNGEMPQMSEGMTPPEMQDGENGFGGFGMGRGQRGRGQMNGEMPEMSDGMAMPQMGEEMTPPEMPSGGMGGRGQMNGEMPQMSEGMTPPDMASGENSENSFGYRGNMGFGGMGGSSEISTEHHIEITGGNIYINAQGDGIDSNGSIVISGGNIVVDGPASNGNGAFDHDGLALINGGTLMAIGSSGMMEVPSTSSEQNVIVYTFDSQSEGSTLTIKNSSGKTIASHTAAKAYQSVIFSSDEIKTGETYTLYVDGEEVETLTVTDTVTSAGSATGGFGMGRGQMGDRGSQQSAQ